MTSNELLTEEHLDYLIEMLNIGAGNASTALSHLLQCEVNMKLPGVDVLPPLQVASALGDPDLPVACVKMKMVADLDGCLFFIVPDGEKAKLADLAERALLGARGPKKEQPDAEQVLSIIAEIGNILAGVYMTAIHDFCKLNICHSVPVLAVDMMQSLLDESLATCSNEDQTIIVVKNEFTIGEDRVRTFFLIFPSQGSVNALRSQWPKQARCMAIDKIHVDMGEGMVVCDLQVLVSAGIGSCLVVTLYDGKRKIGGLAHVMLPEAASGGGGRPPYQCADTAIAALLEGLADKGARRKDMEAKIAGGAKMFTSYDDGSDGIGAQIIRSTKDILAREQIPLVGWDTAGHHGRTVEFHLTSGRLLVKALGKADKEF